MITIELFRLFGTIALHDQEAVQGLNNIDQHAQGTGSRLGGFFKKAGGVMGAALVAGAATAGAGLIALTGVIGKVGIGYNSMMENSKVAWTTLLGTQEKAKTMLEDIADFAKTTQFETSQVDMMAKYMHNAGLEGKALFDELTKVADVSGAFNIPAAEAQELTRQMSQVRQAGVAYTEDLNVLQDRGIPIYKAISEQLGITVGDVKQLASKGKLSSDIYLKAFDNIAKGVQGSSEKQSKTFTGMLSTLKDNLSMISGELTKGAFEKLKSTLDSAMPIIERFSTTLKDEGLKAALSELFGEDKVNKAISLFNTIRDAGVTAFNLLKDAVKFTSDNLNWIIPILSGVVAGITAFKVISTIKTLMDLWRASTIATTLATGGLNAVMAANPIGMVCLAIGLLVAAGVALYMNWDKVTKFLSNSWEWIKSAAVSVFNYLVNFFKKWGLTILAVITGPIGILALLIYKNWDSIKSKTSSIWNSIKSSLANLWDGIKSKASGIWDGIKSKVSGVWDSIKSKTVSVWNGIKSAITTPINAAKEAVSTAISKIKGFFSGLSLKLPKIKTPHFKLKNWSINPLDWVKNMPSIGIDWYAKGTNFAPGGYSIVGERGPELVNLPRGSKVKTANETQQMLKGNQPVNTTIILEIDGESLGSIVLPYINNDQDRQTRIKLATLGM